jgi:hypothetical protein
MEDPAGEFTRKPTGRFEWERILRRAVIKPPSVKLLGLVMGTYANADGSNVRPGRERLAAVMGASMSVVDRGQKSLEELGFLDKVYKGHGAGRGRSGGFASEFQLTVPSDLLDRIPMLDPDEKQLSPLTSGQPSQASPLTTGNAEPLVNPAEPLVRIPEPLVNLSKPLSTSDTPPDHYHHNKDHYTKHQSASVTLSDAHASEILTDLFHTGSDEYASASEYLQRLPDFGQSHLSQVNSEQPLKNRVMAAARLAGWTAERKAS